MLQSHSSAPAGTFTASTHLAIWQATFATSEASAARTRSLLSNPPQPVDVWKPRLSPTALDSLETSLLIETGRCSPNRTEGRNRLLETLSSCAQCDRERQRVEDMRGCGSEWFVGRNSEGILLLTNRCRERQCPDCQRIRGLKHQAHFSSRVLAMENPKLLTLTLKHNNDALGDTITRLINSFAQLRRHAVWKQQVRGGLYVIELTRNKETKQWHVHLHCLINSKFIPHEWISEHWAKVTGDSFIVHIKQADAGTAKYLAKYVSKAIPPNLERFEYWPVYYELRGRRLAGTFGDEPPIDITPDGESEVQILGRLTDIIDAAMSGDPWAREILAELLTTTGGKLPDKPPPKPT